MKKQVLLGLQLFASLFIIASTDIWAQADVTIGKNVEILRQHQWLVFIYRGINESVCIFDSTGQKLDSIYVGNKSIDLVSTDIYGNCMISHNGEMEFSRIAIYYDNKGKEKWRCGYEYIGGGEGFLLSPDGKYAMKQKHRANRFTMFLTADTSKKIPNPYSNLEPSTLCCSQFSEDGTINTISEKGTLYLCNPLTNKITSTIELKTPDNQNLIPYLDLAPKVNADNTLFARSLTNINDLDNSELFKSGWLLVYNNKSGISRLEPVINGPIDVAVIDSQIIMSRQNKAPNRDHSQFETILYKNKKDSGELIDSSRTYQIGTPLPVDKDIYFHSNSQKPSQRYNSLERKMSSNISSIPFFKPRKKGQLKTPKLLISDK